ncbi:hypothetical protein B9Z19DRAFT_454665 [Tuber borchii]|uniref:Uncharacterized protein n=1 Tax=Tuber borchii TaxID=42251 RepID=A0A2T6ZG45_TUBBO|nr:hypothetical protein B9Z19DRAFT_454665 [Tuber borchii]
MPSLKTVKASKPDCVSPWQCTARHRTVSDLPKPIPSSAIFQPPRFSYRIVSIATSSCQTDKKPDRPMNGAIVGFQVSPGSLRWSLRENMVGRQTGAGHIAKADLHDGRFGRKGRKGKEKKKKTWFAIREVHHRIVPYSCTLLANSKSIWKSRRQASRDCPSTRVCGSWQHHEFRILILYCAFGIGGYQS